jgi:hypothetical protein
VLGLGLGSNAIGAAGEDYVSNKFIGGLAKNTQLLDPTGSAAHTGLHPARLHRGEERRPPRVHAADQRSRRAAADGRAAHDLVRGSTKLSGPLLDAIGKGLFKVVRCLPG